MLPQIICTIGPSSINFLTLKKMKENGMNIARINTKYGNPKQWEKMIQNLRKLNIEILIDIKSLKYLDWVKKIKPNYIAVSFAETVNQIKQVNLDNVKIIAKIESIKGVKNSLNLKTQVME
jgi:pyruvate kinase